MSVSIFGLDAGRIRELVDAVAWRPLRDENAETQLADRFARVAWSCIAEPGDGEAGAVIGEAGPATALQAVIEQWPASRAGRAASDWMRALERWRPRVDSAEVLRALTSAARAGVQLIVPEDEVWPMGLASLGDHAPGALWCRGRAEALTALDASIAIVGSRAATGYGEHVAMESSARLIDRGLSIVSGAAYGIDGAAHRAALAGDGVTVAFLAGGADRSYPRGHENLLDRIRDHGAVLSELPCGAAPTRWRFLQRNRLIAAVSSAVVVVEAGLRSGSLNTAGHAAALGKPVGAVPGPVTSPSSAGCHRLLRDFDAVCVTTAEEMAELAGHPDPGQVGGTGGQEPRRSAEETRLLDALAIGRPRAIDEIARRSGLSYRECTAALGALEATGDVVERDGAWTRSSQRSGSTGPPHVGRTL